MKGSKIDKETNGRILTFLNMNWSISMIIKELKINNIYVSKAHVLRLKNGMLNNSNETLNINKKEHKRTRKNNIINEKKIKRLKSMASKPNPISQAQMAKRLDISESSVRYHLKNTIGFSLVSKKKVHHLTVREKDIRMKRSKLLFPFIKDNLDKIISTDEKFYRLDDCNKETKRLYIKKGQNRKVVSTYKKSKSFCKGIMVWAGISLNGKTNIYFAEPGVKISADYYISNILKPFIEKDLKSLYPNNNGILQQDSAPSHTSSKTLNFLEIQNVKFIPPYMWTPNSPDNTPCDYWLWSELDRRISYRKARTIKGLKKVLKDEFEKIPQESIKKAFLAWPTRCKNIYKANGGNIENFI